MSLLQIDHEIISTAIFLIPLIQKYVQIILVNRLVKLAQETCA